MNVAVLSESTADEAAIRILLGGILGVGVPPVHLNLRSRGWPSVLQVLPSVLKHLYYRTDTQALVLVVDSNSSPIHTVSHDNQVDQDCRLCRLRQVISQTQNYLRQRGDRLPLKTAVGLAVPSIEAWYRCGLDGRVTEAAWISRMQSTSPPYSKISLKRDVYGTERPSLLLEEARAVEEANRLVNNLTLLENLFSNGFGALARDVRDW